MGSPGLIPVPAEARWRLGDLSRRHETPFGPADRAKAAATVSTGRQDKGGVSYGPYQLASKMGQVQNFLKGEGAPWAGRFKGLEPTEQGGEFGKVWQAIAAEDPEGFSAAQHGYIKRTHYDPVVANVRRRTGVDIDSQPPAIRDAAWSISVNHSGKGARKILSNGIANAKILAGPGTPDFNIAALDLIYDHRTGHAKQHVPPQDGLRGLLRRYGLERKDARDMLKQQ